MEARLFDPGTTPKHTTPDWYAGRDRAPHLEQDGHRQRLLLARDLILDATARYGIRTVSDMGCGDGGLLSLLTIPCWGYDLQPSNVEAGRRERGVTIRWADVLTDDVEWGDLAVCTEMLEHLIDPHQFVRNIPSRAVVASSPATETAGHHYEFHTWAWDHAGYRTLFEQAGYQVVRHEQSTSFQVLLAVRP